MCVCAFYFFVLLKMFVKVVCISHNQSALLQLKLKIINKCLLQMLDHFCVCLCIYHYVYVCVCVCLLICRLSFSLLPFNLCVVKAKAQFVRVHSARPINRICKVRFRSGISRQRKKILNWMLIGFCCWCRCRWLLFFFHFILNKW